MCVLIFDSIISIELIFASIIVWFICLLNRFAITSILRRVSPSNNANHQLPLMPINLIALLKSKHCDDGAAHHTWQQINALSTFNGYAHIVKLFNAQFDCIIETMAYNCLYQFGHFFPVALFSAFFSLSLSMFECFNSIRNGFIIHCKRTDL